MRTNRKNLITSKQPLVNMKPWTFHKALKSGKKQKPSASPATSQKRKGQITIPYVKGKSEKLRRAYQQYGVSVTLNPLQTLHQRLVAPKDPTALDEKTFVIYHIPCKDGSSVYTDETGRKLKLRLREHKSTASSANLPVLAHTKSGHNINWEGVKVLEKYNRSSTRKITKAIHKRKDPNPKINTSQRFEFPQSITPCWDQKIKILLLEILLEIMDLSSSQHLTTDEETSSLERAP